MGSFSTKSVIMAVRLNLGGDVYETICIRL